jgi:hypothetical protein
MNYPPRSIGRTGVVKEQDCMGKRLVPHGSQWVKQMKV